MPAASTHYIFSLDCLKGTENSVDFSINKSAFYYGAQGPDIFFAHNLLPLQGKSYRKIGSAFHSKVCPTDMLNLIRDYIKNSPDDTVCISYLLGFLCHYSLDSTTHAYIYWLNFKLKKENYPHWWNFTIHNKIEFNIDTVLIGDKLKISDGTDFPIYDTYSTDLEVLGAVARGIKYLCDSLLKTDLSEKEIIRACLQTKSVGKLTTAKAVKRTLCQILELPVRPFLGPVLTMFMRPQKPKKDFDYMNTSHTQWVNPFDENKVPRCDSFYEMYDNALEKYVNIVNGLFKSVSDGSDMTPLTKNLDFSHCVPVDKTTPI